MDFAPRVVRQARVVHGETELVQELGNSHCAGLLAVHADRECLDTAEQQERVEGAEGISDRVDHMGHALPNVGVRRGLWR